MKRKLYLETFGCQMNVLDSELVLGQLRARGYEQVDDRDEADVIIYNTCSVREHAEQKVWSRLGELRARKHREPHIVIGVIGCMAEREGTGIFTRYPHIDVLCGPGELDKLPALVHNACVVNQGLWGRAEGSEGSGFRAIADCQLPIADFEQIGNRQSALGNRAEPSPDHAKFRASPLTPALSPYGERGQKHQVALMGSNVRRSGTLAAAEDHLELLDLSRSVSPGDDVVQSYVRITRGCNKFCTYCVVPYTRGPEVHRPPGNIVEEVKMLVEAGAREVTLLGQTINHYAYEHGDGRTTTFADLLYLIHESVPDLPRLRFVTSFPRDFTNEALQAMRDCPRICRYLHVPAQSGSDRILKLMNRGYTSSQYVDFVARARDYMPDVSIASDFIVGFSTESDQDFQQTVDLVERCRFKNSFIFKYSPRPGTVAIERFEDDVPEPVKRRRNNELLAVQSRICAENNRATIGSVVEVFVEGESKLVSRQTPRAPYPASNVELGWERKQKPSDSHPWANDASGATTQLIGRTRGDQVVCFEGNPALKGKILEVRITDSQNLTLFGQPVDVPLLAG